MAMVDIESADVFVSEAPEAASWAARATPAMLVAISDQRDRDI